MTGHLFKSWCRVCQAKTVQNRVVINAPADQQVREFTVCSQCGEQVS